MGGAILAGTGLTIIAAAGSLPTTDYGFLVSVPNVIQVLAASAFAGAARAVLGAGIGAVVRNVGGAVTTTVLALNVAPPLAVQLANDTASWMPKVLANVLAGAGTDVSTPAAVAAVTAWAAIPAAIGLLAVQGRDVV